MLKYGLFNKPFEVLCQFTDEMGRKTLKDFIKVPGIYSVGRLDYDSEGLLLLTNDVAMNHRISNPKNKVEKTYWAQVEGLPTPEQLAKLKSGVLIEGYKTLPSKVRAIQEPKLWERSKPIRFRKSIPTSWLELTIREGKNRQVRKMTAAVGLPCLRLVRVAIGPLKLEGLLPGKYKEIIKPAI